MYYFYIRDYWKRFMVITLEFYQDLSMMAGYELCTINKYFGGRYIIVYNEKLLMCVT